MTDPDCAEGRRCVGGSCLAAGLCARCAAHDDCGAAEDLCLQLRDGNYCGRACDDRACPEGYVCDALSASAAQRVPVSGGCVCTPRRRKGCAEGHVYWFDACDQPGELYQSCPEGCAGGSCLPDGSDPGFPIARPDVTGGADTATSADAAPGDCGASAHPVAPAPCLLLLVLFAAVRAIRRNHAIGGCADPDDRGARPRAG